jgi:hypothetical protein
VSDKQTNKNMSEYLEINIKRKKLSRFQKKERFKPWCVIFLELEGAPKSSPTEPGVH